MEKDKILRRPEVAKLVGLSEVTISREELAGRFPRRRLIGARSVGWLESEVQKWISQRSAPMPAGEQEFKNKPLRNKKGESHE